MKRLSNDGAKGAAGLRVAAGPATHDFEGVRVIDAHVHLYPPQINADPAGWAAAAGEPHWATLCTRVRPGGRAVQGFPSVDTLLRDMDAAGVDEAVLLGWYWQTVAATELQNRFFEEVVAAHPDRLRACGTWHPAMGVGPLASFRERGFVGIGELSPHSIGYGEGDVAAWAELFAAAGKLGLPVNLHVTDPRSRPFPGKVETPLRDFVGWARQFPQTTFVLAHGGGRMPWFKPDVLRLPNVVFDMAAFPLLYPPPSLDAWVAQCRPGKLLWGSDHPLNLYPRSGDDEAASLAAWRREMVEAGFGDEVRDALLGGNASRVYARR
ncbi:amidohydrolase family protein [Actomonas aquatica]|uniref:Amidohydrolase family protein n=1 Tax=Actomonas aquatica TaxID=2866162 RepID=A0ABZ1C915_9BACT|nr:amidohydrolase family protein [Opitutus sp. WL0086]WRQ88084.1 amidohydrolase family protein [Opitutus sp. WL0086]